MSAAGRHSTLESESGLAHPVQAIVPSPTSASERRLRRENDRLATDLMHLEARLARLRRRDDWFRRNGSRLQADVVNSILPTLDSLDLALHVPDGSQLREGVEIIYRELARTLGQLGLSVVHPRPGEKFDPHLHEAVTLDPDAGRSFGTILSVRRIGYSMGGRLLRAALVDVAG